MLADSLAGALVGVLNAESKSEVALPKAKRLGLVGLIMPRPIILMPLPHLPMIEGAALSTYLELGGAK